MAKFINNIITLTDDFGKRHYSSAIPDSYKITSFPYRHKARMGDRWDTIAYKYLGDAKHWYVVARANGGSNGSIFIKPGTLIIIPEVV